MAASHARLGFLTRPTAQLVGVYLVLTALLVRMARQVASDGAVGVWEPVGFLVCVAAIVAIFATVHPDDAVSTGLTLAFHFVAVTMFGTFVFWGQEATAAQSPALLSGQRFFWAAFSAAVVVLLVGGAQFAVRRLLARYREETEFS